MIVRVPEPEDFAPWLELARQVEALFGEPLVGSESFEGALRRCMGRGTAFCVREGDAEAGAPLLGGLLFSAKPPRYVLGWLAVAERSRRRGVGSLLVRRALSLVLPPAEVTVVTFGKDVAGGEPARCFYERLGFAPAEAAPTGADGASRQVVRRVW